MKEKCSEHVATATPQISVSCTRKVSAHRNGKAYCWQHDPDRVKRLDEERRVKWQVEWEIRRQAEKEKYQLQEVKDACYEACKAIGPPLKVAKHIGAVVEAAKNARQWFDAYGAHGPGLFGGEAAIDEELRIALSQLEEK